MNSLPLSFEREDPSDSKIGSIIVENRSVDISNYSTLSHDSEISERSFRPLQSVPGSSDLSMELSLPIPIHSPRSEPVCSIRSCRCYWEVAPLMSPFDLLLFRGTDFVSGAIRVLSRATTGNGDFSHVGIVVCSELFPHIPELKPGRWYIWESTFAARSESRLARFSDGVESVSGRSFGVQIRDLEDVVNSYTSNGGRVAWASLKNNPWGDSSKRPRLTRLATQLHRSLGHRRYDFNFLTLLAAIFPFLRKPRDKVRKIINGGETILVSAGLRAESGGSRGFPNDWLFCSELVAIIYQHLNIIPESFNPSEVIPVDFLGVDADGLPRLVQEPILLRPTVSR